jgi:hypothetical protein
MKSVQLRWIVDLYVPSLPVAGADECFHHACRRPEAVATPGGHAACAG